MTKHLNTRWFWPAVLFFVFFAVLYIKLAVVGVKITVDMELVDIDHGEFKVYWGENRLYTEVESRRVKVRNGRHQYRLDLPVGFWGDVELRIDPIDKEGTIKLHKISIEQQAMQPITLHSAEDWRKLKPLSQFEVIDIQDGSYKLHATDIDPQLITTVNFAPSGIIQILRISKELIFIAFLCFIFFFVIYPKIERYNYVPIALLAAFVLAVSLAATSKKNGHPDEYVHIAAIDFYTHNWLPPNMFADGIENTFSVYGVSRLSSYEIYYQLAGYAQKLFNFFELDGLTTGRLFNLLLLFGLLLFAWYNVKSRYFLLPLILTSQAWYLFVYANSDALALCLCTFIAYQVAYEKSAFNNYLQDGLAPNLSLKAVALALLFGGLLLIKLNYYFFALFVGLFILYRFVFGEFENKTLFWKRIMLIAVLAFVPFGVRYGLDVAVNGIDRDAMFEELREQYADFPYKPSTPLEKTATNLYFKDKGIGAEEVYSHFRFFEQSFRSAFGVYGYMQFHARENFYEWVRYSGLVLIGLLLLAMVRSLRFSNFVLVAIAGGVSLSLFAISFYESWVMAFQPQGRYFMPVLPILGVVFYRLREYVWRPGVVAMSVWMFLLALYSFAWIAMGSY